MRLLSQRIITAVTWKIVAELCRRHHQRAALRVYELHPGGGLYDCVSIFSGDFPDGELLGSFNQQSEHFHIGSPYTEPTMRLADLRWPEENNYVLSYLQTDDPAKIVRQIEGVLGLAHRPGRLPPTTAPVLCIRLIAEFVARHALSRSGVVIRNGYFDTSGPFQSQVRKEILTVPAIRAQLPDTDDARDKFARRFWLLNPRIGGNGVGPLRAIVDMRGILYNAAPPYDSVQLFDIYTANHALNPLVDYLDRIVSIAP